MTFWPESHSQEGVELRFKQVSGATTSLSSPASSVCVSYKICTRWKLSSFQVLLFFCFLAFFRPGGRGGRPTVDMFYFAQPTCLHVIQTPSSVFRGSERCPIRSCRTQLGCLKQNAVATLEEMLGWYRVESQQTLLPGQKYWAIVSGSLVPHSGHFQPTPWKPH